MNKFLVTHQKPLIIAHRGASANQPENTLDAYQAAIDAGADAIEFDVRLSRDGRVVIMHDPTVNRTTDGLGQIHKMTYAQIKQLSTANGQLVLTLEEILDRFAGKTLIVIDIKNYLRLGNLFSQLEQKVCQLVDKYDIEDDVMFGSFVPWTGRRIKKYLPDACFCFFFFGGWRFIGFGWRKYFDVWGLHATRLAPAAVQRLLRHNLVTNSWVIDDMTTQRKLIDQHISMIVTNKPDQVSKLLHQS